MRTLPTRPPSPATLANSEWLIGSDPRSPVAVVIVGKGRTVAGPTQKAGGLPIVTNAGDQTKNQVVLHVEGPTNPYQNPCSWCETPW